MIYVAVITREYLMLFPSPMMPVLKGAVHSTSWAYSVNPSIRSAHFPFVGVYVALK